MARNRHSNKETAQKEIVGRMAKSWCLLHQATIEDFDQHIADMKFGDFMVMRKGDGAVTEGNIFQSIKND